LDPKKWQKPLLTSNTAKQILEGSTKVSFDLGLSEMDLKISRKTVILPDESKVSFKELEEIKKHDNTVFFSENGKLFRVAISNLHFYNLVPTEGAPTIEIDGIRMHRTKGITPQIDAEEKLNSIKVKHGRILDTCTGLGYTAICSLKNGGSLVVSIEKRFEVLNIAKMNPWSKDLFTNKHLHLIVGDSYSIIPLFPDEFFDYIIHDPPRFSHAGRLYSRNFYFELYRTLSLRGQIFHYTGEPRSRFRKQDFRKGVMHRLRQVGFKKVKYRKKILGITGVKY
jgi:predicted methyltransferase